MALARTQARPPNFPRDETVYTSGSAYVAPTNFNPLNPYGHWYIGAPCGSAACPSKGGSGMTRWEEPYAAGTMGLLYESLFLYDPLHQKYIPWLATGGGWQGDIYTLYIRNGVRWSDGSPLGGADVAFTINLALANPMVPYSALKAEGLIGAKASGNTVTIRFTGSPPYAPWQQYLWTEPVLPMHIWAKYSQADQVAGANMNPVGSGPMLLDYFGPTEVAYKVNPSWWGAAELGLGFRFKYLVDLVAGSPGSQLTKLLAGDIDWSNSSLPGIANILSSRSGTGGYNVVAYYQSDPFMLTAGTAWLVPNTSMAPFDNVLFRRAMACAISTKAVASSLYSGTAAALDPTGLVPSFGAYVDDSAVDHYGFR
ncbi:MAG TPA: ABC transporter substrate-binding protein, partial [Acidimicrobiales bacterium]|nr:ABC transporter substrate-binding protein [Acidimicrobiales bacterium]